MFFLSYVLSFQTHVDFKSKVFKSLLDLWLKIWKKKNHLIKWQMWNHFLNGSSQLIKLVLRCPDYRGIRSHDLPSIWRICCLNCFRNGDMSREAKLLSRESSPVFFFCQVLHLESYRCEKMSIGVLFINQDNATQIFFKIIGFLRIILK